MVFVVFVLDFMEKRGDEVKNTMSNVSLAIDEERHPPAMVHSFLPPSDAAAHDMITAETMA